MLIAEQLSDDYNCESGDENAAIDDSGDAIEAKVDEDEEEPLLNYESVESFILKVKRIFCFYSVTSPFAVSPVTCSFSSSLCNKRDLNCLVARGASKILSSLLSIPVAVSMKSFRTFE